MRGGLGKTFTVLKQIENKNLVRKDITEQIEAEEEEENEREEKEKPNYDFVHVKGFSTAKGLYRILYENSDKLIIFDDCDEVLRNDIAKNILKGALDSYDERIISWMVSKDNFSGDGLPTSFKFTGRIIFISNLDQSRIAEAILSRCMSIDLTMSPSDKIERMRAILPNIKTIVPTELKEECLTLIEDHMEQCNNLNIRTLLKVIDIRFDQENGDSWRDMAIYAMTSTVS